MNSRNILTCGTLVAVLLSSVMAAHYGEAAGAHSHHGQRDQIYSADRSDNPTVLIQMDTGAGPLTAGKDWDIFFLITDKQGNPVENLTISHERLLHVVIISEDFSTFAHIHPEDFGQITAEMKTKARFPVRYSFPIAGRYLIAVDTSVRDSHISKQFQVTVEGEPKVGAVRQDLSAIKSFGKYAVSLKTVPERVRAGEKTILRYEISTNGQPVKDLEQYLGAPMHLAIVMTDLGSFIHAHGDTPGSSHDHIHTGHIHGAARESIGPEIEAEVVFPQKGTYRIFSQIQHRGKVMLLDFTVQVN